MLLFLLYPLVAPACMIKEKPGFEVSNNEAMLFSSVHPKWLRKT